MGVHHLPQLEDYWSSHTSYRHFCVLLSCLHLVDNSTAVCRGEDGFDKLHKIIQLANPLLDKSCFLYYNNYFSSVHLATTRLSRNTYTIATKRCNRKKWPEALKDVKEMTKALQSGQHRSVFVQSEQVECVAWKNSKVVTMINTISNPSSLTHEAEG